MTRSAPVLSRRDLLYLSVMAAASGIASGCKMFSFGPQTALEQALSALDGEAAQVVSRELVALDTKFGDIAYLQEALKVFRVVAEGDTKGGSPISQTIVADFRSKRTVKVSGWVLAETEAMVIALKALGGS